MSKKMFKLIFLAFIPLALMYSVEGGDRFVESASQELLDFMSPVEERQYHYMHAWAGSGEATALRNDRAIEAHDPDFYCFLHDFVTNSQVKGLLDRRVHIDFKGRKAADIKDYEELVDLMLTVDERARIRIWLGEFKELLATRGATIHPNPVHVEPGTVVFSFDKYPGYVVKGLVWNYYPLGCYDLNGLYSCLVPGCKISGYSFPLQLVSRVLYSEEIRKFVREHGINNVSVPEKWLYIFPWAVNASLEDKNLFVIAQKINVKKEEQEHLLESLKREIRSDGQITGQRLAEMAEHQAKYPLLANMVRVIMAAGLYDFSPKTQNFVLLRLKDDPEIICAFFTDLERPSFGGGNPLSFFHKKDPGSVSFEELASNGRVGLSIFASLLNSLHAGEGSN